MEKDDSKDLNDSRVSVLTLENPNLRSKHTSGNKTYSRHLSTGSDLAKPNSKRTFKEKLMKIYRSKFFPIFMV